MEILKEAFVDSLKLLPILFLVYLLIEYLEHKNNNKAHHMFMRSKKAGPLAGGLLGCIPQCGFSVIASELYSKKVITLGTLVAIFVATSDEAIPILLAEPGRFPQMLMLVVMKLVIAIVAGYIIDLFVKNKVSRTGCEHEHSEHHHFHGNCEDCHDGIVRSAIIHSIRIFVFIFIVSIALGFVMEYAGGSLGFLARHKWLQVFITPIVGLVPNCAASVVLTELYIAGGVTLGALTGGLCAGAGVGLIVLFRLNKSVVENFTILGIMYAVGVIAGGLLSIMGV